MAQRSLSVSVSLPTEWDEKIQREAKKRDMTYSQYVRHVIREHEETPFECDDPVLCKDENYADGRRSEGAA